MEIYYNIHNIVKIIIDTRHAGNLKEYDYYLRHFKVLQKPDVIDITIKDFETFVPPKNAINRSDTFFAFDGGFYKKNSYGLEYSKGKMTLYAKDNDIGINTLIEYFLLRKQCTFMHGAAISYKDKGIIFPAPPNTGKTLLISRMRQVKEVKFFADDYFIAGVDGKLYSYPMDFSVYDYHFDFFPELKKSPEQLKIKKAFFESVVVNLVKNLPIKKTLKKIARAVGYDFLQGGQYLKIPSSRLIEKEAFGNVASLAFTIFLERHQGSEFIIEKILPEKAANEIVGILQTEWQVTMPVLHEWASFGTFDFSEYMVKIHQVAKAVFEKTECYKVIMPMSMDNAARMQKLEEFLNKEIFIKI